MEEQMAAMRSWILSRNPDCEDLEPDTELLDGPLLDSLEFIAFLVLVEDLRGSPIDPATVDRDAFRTLEDVCRNFLAGSPR